jgi:broad-specificity NMP kinase
MGVGKTTTCQLLKRKLNNSVFLDGDWCWDAHPFQVTDETKAMVIDNIRYLLNSFIRCSAYENIIFCWVMHEQSIIDDILWGLNTDFCNVKSVSLVCTADALTERLQKDVDAGIRTADVIERSIKYIPLYNKLNTIQINVSEISSEEAANKIALL